MFHLDLFKIRAFTFGNLASLLAGLGRGGLMFILIIWLQGIWLPRHGYSFESTPLWAGIFMLPMTVGFLVAGPLSGWLSDRYGARPFATGGMLIAALSFFWFAALPVDFTYWMFAAALFCQRLRDGTVRLAQPGRDDELPAGQPARRRRRHEHDVPEHLDGALDRHLLLADDRRAGRVAAGDHADRPDGARRTGGAGARGRRPAAGRGAVRVAARLQPGAVAARRPHAGAAAPRRTRTTSPATRSSRR